MTAKRQTGFTLLELMITIAVVAILVAIAYPSMTAFLQRDQAVAQSNNIRANLQFARGQAAATRAYVSICPLAAAGGSTCATTGVYDLGWMVYSAAAPNVAYNAATAGNAILLSVAAPTNALIRANQSGPLTYNARGELLANVASTGTPTNVIFKTCAKSTPADLTGVNTTKVPGIQLSASSSGRVASSTLAAGVSCTS
jgi:type IV fimbrial biogenesis protein FimT